MSRYHEHVTWQGEDGKWSVGFYRAYSSPRCDEVDFDENKFEFASNGHDTAEDAERSWRGPNPGYSNRIPYTDQDIEEIQYLNKMHAEYQQEQTELRRARETSRPVRWW